MHQTPETRHQTAQKIAAAAGLAEEPLQAGPFILTSFGRVGHPDAAADLYIEGDGLAWLDKYTVSTNPTPPDPLGLHLAAADTGANVIYLARPCQYTGWTGEGACPEKYWTQGVSAPEVIAAYQQALDSLKASKHLSGFNLIGYSGGGGIAALVAAGRHDVLSLRTVAGNTHYAVFTDYHHVSPISLSVAPESVAAKLAHLPQRHFVGGDDKIVPQLVFEGWQQATGASNCLSLSVIPGNTHDKGWVEAWPGLLAQPVSCEK